MGVLYFERKDLRLYCGDCFDIMAELFSAGETFDMIFCDMPYGSTRCKWDVVLPLHKVWKFAKTLLNKNGVVLFFGTEPFASMMRTSNLEMYRYDWIWDKGRGTNFANARKMPMQSTERVCVFWRNGERPEYHPQWWYSKPYRVGARKRKNAGSDRMGENSSAAVICPETISEDGRRYPKDILRFNRDPKTIHPTQKPVALLKYLIKTYQTADKKFRILDFCAGSCSVGVAALQTGAECVLIEKNEKYCASAAKRLQGVVL